MDKLSPMQTFSRKSFLWQRKHISITKKEMSKLTEKGPKTSNILLLYVCSRTLSKYYINHFPDVVNFTLSLYMPTVRS